MRHDRGDELSPIPRREAGEISRYASLGRFAVPQPYERRVAPALASIEHAADGTLTPRAAIGGDLTWHLTPTMR